MQSSRDNVFQEPERVCDPVFVDYGANEPGECVCEEAGRLFLHCQHLSSKMRLEMPQSAHHSHLCIFQALPGMSMCSRELLTICGESEANAMPCRCMNGKMCRSMISTQPKSNLFILSPL